MVVGKMSEVGPSELSKVVSTNAEKNEITVSMSAFAV